MPKRLLVTLLAAALLVPAVSSAATKNGVTPLTPKAGSTVALGSSPTFRMRVRGKGKVFLHVCKSSRRNKEGVICDKALIVQAKRKSGTLFRVKPEFFDFPEFWLNNAGTYYWQAYRIDCTGNMRDCKRESPVVKFRVG